MSDGSDRDVDAGPIGGLVAALLALILLLII